MRPGVKSEMDRRAVARSGLSAGFGAVTSPGVDIQRTPRAFPVYFEGIISVLYFYRLTFYYPYDRMMNVPLSLLGNRGRS